MEFILIAVLILVAVIALVYLLRYPEIALGIFLFSYVIEGGMSLPWFLNLTLVMFVIAVLGFIAQLTIGKKNNFRLQSVDFWLLGFIIILFAGSYLVPNPEAGFIKALRFATIVFFPYLLARVFFNECAQIYRFLKTILVLAAIICIALIAISIKQGITGRMALFEANEIPTATLFAVGLVLTVIEAMMPSQRNWKLDRILYVAIIPVFLYGIFLTGVRGPLIAAVVGLALYFFIGFLKRITPKFRVACITALILIIIGFYYLGDRLPNIEAYSLTTIREGLSTAERLEQYSLVRNLFSQSPLLGVGTNGFEQLTGWGYPHNIFMEVAVENGLIGLIFFGTFLGIVGWYGFRFLAFYYRRLDMPKQKIGLIILTISLVLLVGRQFSFGLDMHKDLFVFLALIVNLPVIVKLDLGLKQNKVEKYHELQKTL